jgi:serine/threonine-protein kinase
VGILIESAGQISFAAMIGTKLAHYEITAHLGSGGMGDVYQATDAKLGRSVAIKFLPEAFSHDTERVARFQREARVLASLNHSNIAAIYGVEEINGRHFLVMELVPGETLADRVGRVPLPVGEAMSLAKQIAEALEDAHERGVVHRDLKPANIKVTPEGKVKVLDFGLAKAYEREYNVVSASNSPTLSLAATNSGVIFGTAAYMAPEQAAGKNVDKRADIWSFGVVLWEMLTNSSLFGSGETVSHILADVLRAPINFEKIPDQRLRELLQRCLDRDVRTRLRDIGEARVALSKPAGSIESVGPALPPSRAHSKLWPAAVVALAISTAVSLWAPWRAEPERPLKRLEVDLGAEVSLPSNAAQGTVVLSPDGMRVAYQDVPPALAVSLQPALSDRGGQNLRQRNLARNLGPRLFVRRLDEDKPVELPEARGGFNFFFSPDSQWLAFFRGGTVYKIAVAGGAAVPIADYMQGGGGDWSPDGTIILGGGSGLWLVPRGSKPAQITKVENGVRAHLAPHFLPGGKAVLYTAISGERTVTATAIEAVSLKDGSRKEVLRGAVCGQYLPSGALVYVTNGVLYAIGFDPETLETRGTAVPLVADVQYNSPTGLTNFSLSTNGMLVYRKGQATAPSNSSEPATLDWIDASGKHSPLVNDPQRFSRPRISPDGKQLAVLISDTGSRDYWIYDLSRGTRNKITRGDLAVSTVAWSPDSRYVFFGGGQGGKQV